MPSRTHTLLAAAAACAALAIPATASAKDFCVGAPAGCSGTPVAAADLKSALDAAQSNGTDDRFILAPKTYTADELTYQSLERMQIIGAGAGKTIINTTGLGFGFRFGGNPGSAISGVTYHPAKDADIGLFLTAGATLSRSRVAVDDDGWGVVTTDQATVADSVIDAPGGAGIVAAGTDMTVRRSTLRAEQAATVAKGHLGVSDTLIDIRAQPFGIGVNAAAGSNLGSGIATADVDRVTIVGSNPSGTDIAGVVAQGDGAGNGGVIKMRDSVISGIGLPVARLGRTGATANVTTDRSSYGASSSPSFDSGPGKLTETRRLIVSPQFVGNGDFHLATGSPLIDAGTPGSTPAGALDRDGRQRASDGNGDCARISDIGAFEYQGTKVKAIAHAAAAAAAAGKPVAYSAAGSCIPGPEAATIVWRFDDGASAAGASVAHAYVTPGRHTATVTVSDAHGHSAQAATAVTVTALPPRITRLRVAHGKVRFRLSESATVTLRLTKPGTHRTRKITAHQGTNTTRLRKLKPGRYRLTAVATDKTGQHSKPVRARFKVV